MSNRKLEQANGLAALKIAHEQQIEALLAPGLSREERINRFCAAAGVNPGGAIVIIRLEPVAAIFAPPKVLPSAACAVWRTGQYPKSLFADLPHCRCPVLEVSEGRMYHPLIPAYVPYNWSPTREVLEAFAQIQQEARFPGAG